MSIVVAPLALSDPATLEAIVALQRAGYAVEAELIGAASLPPMRETPEQLRDSRETILGAHLDGSLAGVLGYRRTGDEVEIHRLAVAPAAFRRGVASALLDALETREAGAARWTVGTGTDNTPARRLYERRGFVAVEERLLPGAIRWTRLVRDGRPADE